MHVHYRIKKKKSSKVVLKFNDDKKKETKNYVRVFVLLIVGIQFRFDVLRPSRRPRRYLETFLQPTAPFSPKYQPMASHHDPIQPRNYLNILNLVSPYPCRCTLLTQKWILSKNKWNPVFPFPCRDTFLTQ